MKVRSRFMALAATAVVALGALLGLAAAPASATEISPRKVCAYEYQARCVTWVTTNDTCYRIFERTTDAFKRQACAIYNTQGIVTVIG
ncbi:hypothetical protein [Agromyces sp. NPDC058126]|uniref:hypothetical protein n=1 Tax=Agromyces sp. NPDC058126 TaxID=3346350 RepID=UPI0036DC0BBE